MSRPCAIVARILDPPWRKDGRLVRIARAKSPGSYFVCEKMGQLGDQKLTQKEPLTKSCANGASYFAPPKARNFTVTGSSEAVNSAKVARKLQLWV